MDEVAEIKRVLSLFRAVAPLTGEAREPPVAWWSNMDAHLRARLLLPGNVVVVKVGRLLTSAESKLDIEITPVLEPMSNYRHYEIQWDADLRTPVVHAVSRAAQAALNQHARGSSPTGAGRP